MSENQRIEFGHLPVEERIKSFRDFTIPLNDDEVHAQSLRCLYCGTPFCSNNCPLHNRPVDWNRLVREGDWERAWACLSATNSFPEFTSRVCPAICEAGCTRYLLDDAAVGIRSIERAVIDRAWREGWVRPEPAAVRTGRRVAVVGSGPAGLACAQQLARAGHDVTVYEKSERPGGLLRFGIPGFKLEKDVVERRISQLEAEGVRFELSVVVGDRKFEAGVHNAAKRSVKAADLLGEYDAVVLACGSEVPRDLKVPGREGRGVFFALDVLQEQNRVDEGLVKKPAFDCRGCDVVIVGGGDTGSDCVGTARRQGAGRIWQLDLSPMPPEKDDKSCWPAWPRKLRTSTSHEEGCERLWEASTKEILLNDKGEVRGVRCVKLKWSLGPDGRFTPSEVPDSAFEIPCQRVLLAMGFMHPAAATLKSFGVETDARGNAKAGVDGSEAPFATSVPGVFACGDTRSGQSLVVRAMSEGRRCARAVDVFLTGDSELPSFRP